MSALRQDLRQKIPQDNPLSLRCPGPSLLVPQRGTRHLHGTQSLLFSERDNKAALELLELGCEGVSGHRLAPNSDPVI